MSPTLQPGLAEGRVSVRWELDLRRRRGAGSMRPLCERGIPVEYLLAEDEGHGFDNPENQVLRFRAIERHLAAHLGGRIGPRSRQ